jgi:hypothetical protein
LKIPITRRKIFKKGIYHIWKRIKYYFKNLYSAKDKVSEIGKYLENITQNVIQNDKKIVSMET